MNRSDSPYLILPDVDSDGFYQPRKLFLNGEPVTLSNGETYRWRSEGERQHVWIEDD